MTLFIRYNKYKQNEGRYDAQQKKSPPVNESQITAVCMQQKHNKLNILSLGLYSHCISMRCMVTKLTLLATNNQ